MGLKCMIQESMETYGIGRALHDDANRSAWVCQGWPETDRDPKQTSGKDIPCRFDWKFCLSSCQTVTGWHSFFSFISHSGSVFGLIEASRVWRTLIPTDTCNVPIRRSKPGKVNGLRGLSADLQLFSWTCKKFHPRECDGVSYYYIRNWNEIKIKEVVP